jgi:hypothetical protein
MGNAPDNHWRIPGSEQKEPRRRDQVLKAITLELVTNGIDAQHRGGANPYDSRLGSPPRDIWGQKRRA